MKIIHLKLASDIYNILTRNDSSYIDLIKIGPIDLMKTEDCNHILRFLRSWRCRQFSKESTNQSINSIQDWYKKYKNYLPIININILKFNFENIDDCINDLAERIASLRKGKNVKIGYVGAAKLLFAFRPNTFSPWDNPIINEIGKDNNNNISYYHYIKFVKSLLRDLEKECEINKLNIESLPKIIDKENSTLPKLIDEYLWMTITNGFNPENIIKTISTWNYTSLNI